MAVTVNNGTQTPIVGTETTIATIAGGPFDLLSVYFIGGTGGSGGPIGVNLYATVNAIPTLIGSAQVMGSATGSLVEFADLRTGATGTTSLSPGAGSTFLVDAAGSTYTVKVVDLSTAPLPPGGTARQSCSVTLAGVNAADTAAATPQGAAFVALAAGATSTLTVFPGFQEQIDVAAGTSTAVPVTVSVTADCGPGSVSVVVASRTFTGVSTVNALFRNLQLPVATEYFVSVTNAGSVAVTGVLTGFTYSGTASGGGGAVVLSPEVSGPSNNNVVTGPFSQATLNWKNTVLAAQLGTNVATGTFTLAADANVGVERLAAGVQNGVALGANFASTGHIRLCKGTQILVRNGTNSGDNVFFNDDGANNVALGTGYASWLFSPSTFDVVAGTQIALETTSGFFDATTLQFRDAAHANTLLLTNAGAGTTSLQFASGVTAAQITWAAAAAAAGIMTIQGQAPGVAGDGGPLVLSGGVHVGASKADGSVQIVTPINAGFFTTAPAAGANNLTNAQSNANVFLFTGAPAGGFTINLVREIADTSYIMVKNASTQTATISYLTGGTVTVATNTSAIICSDGANLQKIVTGT